MTEPHTQQEATRSGTSHECCSDEECKSGLRNNYYKGKRLSPSSFRVEQKYLVERRRLLNRAIHGWGVVYGYAVQAALPTGAASGRLKIGPGLALDKCGRELLSVASHEIALNDVTVLKEGKEPFARVEREQAIRYIEEIQGCRSSACWMLRAHYAEQLVEQVRINDPCSCERHEWDWTCETVRYSLQPVDCKECCDDFGCELECECGKCCEEFVRDSDAPCDDEPRPAPRAVTRRGGCGCLCHHLTKLKLAGDCCHLCEVTEPCAHVRVDFGHGVPLVCVNLVGGDCHAWAFGTKLEACGPRRLVKRNDLLFDLIRGCDLTHIDKIGWAKFHRGEISFDDFSDALGPASDGSPKAEYVTTLFWVRFSRPVRKETVQPDCFAMTIMNAEREGGWWQVFRVPILRVETEPPKDGSDDLVIKAWIVVHGGWLEDAVRGRQTLFLDDDARVEIEVRGDYILDCNGQTIDANAVGLVPAPTGNGTPGGTFVSSFTVKKREDRSSTYGMARATPGGRS